MEIEICNECYNCEKYYLNNDEICNCQGLKEKCHEFIEVKSFEDWWNNDLDDIEREEYNRIMEESEDTSCN